MPTDLADRLRVATRALHTQVERSGLMHQLLRGQLPRDAYVRLLRNLQAIYSALEDTLQHHAADGQLSRFSWAALLRSDALQRDLLALHGPGWPQLALVPAAERYAGHLRQLGEQQPLLLAAHAYVRYLGDLNGGQMLARVVAKSLGLTSDEGLSFYDFGTPADAAALAQVFRHQLAQLANSEEQAQALVQEACDAFVRHRDLFEQLAVA